MDKFKIGDRVLFKCNITTGDIEKNYQDTGTILSEKILHRYAVRLDHRYSRAHTCNGKTKEGYGYFCEEDDLRKIPQKRRYKKPIHTLRSFLLPRIDTKGEVIYNDNRSNEAKY